MDKEEDSRYYQSFSVHEREAYKTFFEKTGFVVIDDVLTQDECKESIEEIWRYLEDRGMLGVWFSTFSQKPFPSLL